MLNGKTGTPTVPDWNGRQDQHRFVSEWFKSYENHLHQVINSGGIPENWDGHELQCLIAAYAAEGASISVIAREPRRKRAKDFKNHLRITPGMP